MPIHAQNALANQKKVGIAKNNVNTDDSTTCPQLRIKIVAGHDLFHVHENSSEDAEQQQDRGNETDGTSKRSGSTSSGSSQRHDSSANRNQVDDGRVIQGVTIEENISQCVDHAIHCANEGDFSGMLQNLTKSLEMQSLSQITKDPSSTSHNLSKSAFSQYYDYYAGPLHTVIGIDVNSLPCELQQITDIDNSGNSMYIFPGSYFHVNLDHLNIPLSGEIATMMPENIDGKKERKQEQNMRNRGKDLKNRKQDMDGNNTFGHIYTAMQDILQQQASTKLAMRPQIFSQIVLDDQHPQYNMEQCVPLQDLEQILTKQLNQDITFTIYQVVGKKLDQQVTSARYPHMDQLVTKTPGVLGGVSCTEIEDKVDTGKNALYAQMPIEDFKCNSLAQVQQSSMTTTNMANTNSNTALLRRRMSKNTIEPVEPSNQPSYEYYPIGTVRLPLSGLATNCVSQDQQCEVDIDRKSLVAASAYATLKYLQWQAEEVQYAAFRVNCDQEAPENYSSDTMVAKKASSTSTKNAKKPPTLLRSKKGDDTNTGDEVPVHGILVTYLNYLLGTNTTDESKKGISSPSNSMLQRRSSVNVTTCPDMFPEIELPVIAENNEVSVRFPASQYISLDGHIVHSSAVLQKLQELGLDAKEPQSMKVTLVRSNDETVLLSSVVQSILTHLDPKYMEDGFSDDEEDIQSDMEESKQDIEPRVSKLTAFQASLKLDNDETQIATNTVKEEVPLELQDVSKLLLQYPVVAHAVIDALEQYRLSRDVTVLTSLDDLLVHQDVQQICLELHNFLSRKNENVVVLELDEQRQARVQCDVLRDLALLQLPIFNVPSEIDIISYLFNVQNNRPWHLPMPTIRDKPCCSCDKHLALTPTTSVRYPLFANDTSNLIGSSEVMPFPQTGAVTGFPGVPGVTYNPTCVANILNSSSKFVQETLLSPPLVTSSCIETVVAKYLPVFTEEEEEETDFSSSKLVVENWKQWLLSCLASVSVTNKCEHCLEQTLCQYIDARILESLPLDSQISILQRLKEEPVEIPSMLSLKLTESILRVKQDSLHQRVSNALASFTNGLCVSDTISNLLDTSYVHDLMQQVVESFTTQDPNVDKVNVPVVMDTDKFAQLVSGMLIESWTSKYVPTQTNTTAQTTADKLSKLMSTAVTLTKSSTEAMVSLVEALRQLSPQQVRELFFREQNFPFVKAPTIDVSITVDGVVDVSKCLTLSYQIGGVEKLPSIFDQPKQSANKCALGLNLARFDGKRQKKAVAITSVSKDNLVLTPDLLLDTKEAAPHLAATAQNVFAFLTPGLQGNGRIQTSVGGTLLSGDHTSLVTAQEQQKPAALVGKTLHVFLTTDSVLRLYSYLARGNQLPLYVLLAQAPLACVYSPLKLSQQLSQLQKNTITACAAQSIPIDSNTLQQPFTGIYETVQKCNENNIKTTSYCQAHWGVANIDLSALIFQNSTSLFLNVPVHSTSLKQITQSMQTHVLASVDSTPGESSECNIPVHTVADLHNMDIHIYQELVPSAHEVKLMEKLEPVSLPSIPMTSPGPVQKTSKTSVRKQAGNTAALNSNTLNLVEPKLVEKDTLEQAGTCLTMKVQLSKPFSAVVWAEEPQPQEHITSVTSSLSALDLASSAATAVLQMDIEDLLSRLPLDTHSPIEACAIVCMETLARSLPAYIVARIGDKHILRIILHSQNNAYGTCTVQDLSFFIQYFKSIDQLKAYLTVLHAFATNIGKEPHLAQVMLQSFSVDNTQSLANIILKQFTSLLLPKLQATAQQAQNQGKELTLDLAHSICDYQDIIDATSTYHQSALFAASNGMFDTAKNDTNARLVLLQGYMHAISQQIQQHKQSVSIELAQLLAQIQLEITQSYLGLAFIHMRLEYKLEEALACIQGAYASASCDSLVELGLITQTANPQSRVQMLLKKQQIQPKQAEQLVFLQQLCLTLEALVYVVCEAYTQVQPILEASTSYLAEQNPMSMAFVALVALCTGNTAITEAAFASLGVFFKNATQKPCPSLELLRNLTIITLPSVAKNKIAFTDMCPATLVVYVAVLLGIPQIYENAAVVLATYNTKVVIPSEFVGSKLCSLLKPKSMAPNYKHSRTDQPPQQQALSYTAVQAGSYAPYGNDSLYVAHSKYLTSGVCQLDVIESLLVTFAPTAILSGDLYSSTPSPQTFLLCIELLTVCMQKLQSRGVQDNTLMPILASLFAQQHVDAALIHTALLNQREVVARQNEEEKTQFSRFSACLLKLSLLGSFQSANRTMVMELNIVDRVHTHVQDQSVLGGVLQYCVETAYSAPLWWLAPLYRPALPSILSLGNLAHTMLPSSTVEVTSTTSSPGVYSIASQQLRELASTHCKMNDSTIARLLPAGYTVLSILASSLCSLADDGIVYSLTTQYPQAFFDLQNTAIQTQSLPPAPLSTSAKPTLSTSTLLSMHQFLALGKPWVTHCIVSQYNTSNTTLSVYLQGFVTLYSGITASILGGKYIVAALQQFTLFTKQAHVHNNHANTVFTSLLTPRPYKALACFNYMHNALLHQEAAFLPVAVLSYGPLAVNVDARYCPFLPVQHKNTLLPNAVNVVDAQLQALWTTDDTHTCSYYTKYLINEANMMKDHANTDNNEEQNEE